MGRLIVTGLIAATLIVPFLLIVTGAVGLEIVMAGLLIIALTVEMTSFLFRRLKPGYKTPPLPGMTRTKRNVIAGASIVAYVATAAMLYALVDVSLLGVGLVLAVCLISEWGYWQVATRGMDSASKS